MPKQRKGFSPRLDALFKYQSDYDKDKFEKDCRKYRGGSWLQFAEMLSSNAYTRYIKDLFNKDTTMTYLNKTLSCSKKSTSKDSPLLPPYGISFKSLTSDVGPP